MVTLAFVLSSDGPCHVAVTAFTALGRPVAQPLRPTLLTRGRYALVWHGTDGRGEPVSEGRYIVEYRADENRAIRAVAWPMDRQQPA